MSEKATKIFNELGPIDVDKIKKDYEKYSISLNQDDVTIKQLNNIHIDELSFNYNGMVCNKTNKPHGYGRAIRKDNKWFYDGQFKDG